MMGCGASVREKEAYAISAKIDKEIENQRQKTVDVLSLLLLGAGQSGKSTIMKQMQIIHQEGFSVVERISYKHIVHSNALQSMTTILQAMEMLGIECTDESSKSIRNSFLKKVLISSKVNPSKLSLTRDLGLTMSRLWNDSGVKACFLRSREYQLNDSTSYFLNSLARISDPYYVPTEEDVLMTRIRTTGIAQTQFNYKNMMFTMYDVGGQRSYRKRWLFCFEEVTAILFCTALSEYDLTLEEDETTNRMMESLNLFDGICNNRLLSKKSILLFLNKIDLFETKILKSPLKVCFSDYDGPEGSATEAISFIKEKFESIKQEVYIHLTCAIETKNIEAVFDVATDIIIKEVWNQTRVY